MNYKNTIVQHHLLEIILWPNEDDTFTVIRNSVARLKELGIYADYKLTIPLTRAEHCKLHNAAAGRAKSEEHRRKLSEAARRQFADPGQRKKMSESLKGRQKSADTRKKMREAWARRKAQRINIEQQ